MKSITIHKLDELLTEKLDSLAKKNGESLNATIKQLLSRSLGFEPGHSRASQKGYRQFLGLWDEADAKAFKGATVDFEIIDQADWQS